MKKIYSVIAVCAALFAAVDAEAQITVGAGYNHGVVTTRTTHDTDTEGLDGFYVEATYDWNFLERSWGMLALQPGVRFTYMGDSELEKEPGLTARESFNETYFDVPVHVKYSYPIGKLTLSAYAGPVFSLGLTSVTKASVSGEFMDYTAKYHLYSGKLVTKGDAGSSEIGPDGMTADYGRFDLKLGVGVGAAFADRFCVKVGYNFGLLNRYTGTKIEGVKASWHTGVFYAGVGISF